MAKIEPQPEQKPTPAADNSSAAELSRNSEAQDPESGSLGQESDKLNEALEKVIEKQLGSLVFNLKSEGVVITKSELKKRLLAGLLPTEPPAQTDLPAKASSILADLAALKTATWEEAAAAPQPAEAMGDGGAPALPDNCPEAVPAGQASPAPVPPAQPAGQDNILGGRALEASLAQTIPPIHPAYFEAYTVGLTWDDDDPLLSFGEDEEPWRLKDAFEGLLIMGAPGSGKTSGSGNTFAREFLRAGFGGLVLCAKPGEAQRWQKLCEEEGRGPSVYIVNEKSGHKLNFLAYESQRPGGEFGRAENLVKLFRVLVEAISTGESHGQHDSFWVNATNQLMRSLFEAFILAREPLTVDGLNRFLSKAPKTPLRDPANDWRGIPIFGEILGRAGQVTTEGERRVFEHILDYWTQEFPSYGDKTRSSFTLGFSAMADILSGRGIHELACGITTITPEVILCGGIIILDLPIKTYGQGGLLIQAAWKHLFQMAVERRAMADNDTHRYQMFYCGDDGVPHQAEVSQGMGDRRCPVFLWEDEGQFFFSKHDIDFQATCRESRTAHVVISQNLHNFYQRGHGKHAVEGVFALMNTQIFHCNGDMETNQWAAEKIGKELKTRYNFSISSTEQPQQAAEKGRSKNSGSSSSKNWELFVRPEKFSTLKKGGDGTCEAVALWMSHQFANNDGKPFEKLIFNQG